MSRFSRVLSFRNPSNQRALLAAKPASSRHFPTAQSGVAVEVKSVLDVGRSRLALTSMGGAELVEFRFRSEPVWSSLKKTVQDEDVKSLFLDKTVQGAQLGVAVLLASVGAYAAKVSHAGHWALGVLGLYLGFNLVMGVIFIPIVSPVISRVRNVGTSKRVDTLSVEWSRTLLQLNPALSTSPERREERREVILPTEWMIDEARAAGLLSLPFPGEVTSWLRRWAEIVLDEVNFDEVDRYKALDRFFYIVANHSESHCFVGPILMFLRLRPVRALAKGYLFSSSSLQKFFRCFEAKFSSEIPGVLGHPDIAKVKALYLPVNASSPNPPAIDKS